MGRTVRRLEEYSVKGYDFDIWRLQRRAQRLGPDFATTTRPGMRLLDLPTTQVHFDEQ